MIPTVLDFETGLIRPGLRIPPPAIATTYHPQDGARLWTTAELPAMLERVLQGHVLGQYIAFDMSVAAEWYPQLRPLIWAAYESDRILDIGVAEKIIHIQRSQPCHSEGLGVIGSRYGIPFRDKSDEAIRELRMTFGQFIGAKTIPDAHARYALQDAVDPHVIWQRQLATDLVSIPDVAHFCRQDFWLTLVSAAGFRTDPDHVKIFEERVQRQLALLDQLAIQQGFLRPDGSQDMTATKTAVFNAYGGVPPVTKTGIKLGVKPQFNDAGEMVNQDDVIKYTACDRVALEDAGGTLEELANWKQWRSAGSKDVDLLRSGVVMPIHTDFGLAATGRATSRNPNAQNWAKGAVPKEGDPFSKIKVWGVRECIRPREGKAYVTTDIKGLENASLAQNIIWQLGLRNMANEINAGIDLHAKLGASMLGVSYEDMLARRKSSDPAVAQQAEEYRDAAKPGRFGLSGGMRKWQTLQSYARKNYGVPLSEEKTKAVMAAFYQSEIDPVAWLARAKGKKNALGRYDSKLPLRNIWRRNVSQTVFHNSPFQSLGMEVATVAGWNILRAEYLTRTLPGKTNFFVHDDYTTECKPEDIEQVAAMHEQCIVEAGLQILPDVKISGDTKALTHLSKHAKASFSGGRLQVTKVQV